MSESPKIDVVSDDEAEPVRSRPQGSFTSFSISSILSKDTKKDSQQSATPTHLHDTSPLHHHDPSMISRTTLSYFELYCYFTEKCTVKISTVSTERKERKYVENVKSS
ncbi:hypothetical protein O3M35_012654 [Rhynocoris fuscipes]|uniref:Uncharacterized protein n=1 Tax=Rhynocoris fuscipes TaxID=488301 RepID=A0AAW1CZK2_9HEMI